MLDAVESIAAALRIRVQGADDVGGAVAAWASAGTLLVGPDLAPALASEVLRRRPRVYLVGFDAADLGPWSVPLGAEVIPLPQAVAWLSDVLGASDDTACPVVAVVGGSGGAGASTVAASLALASARGGSPAALVDADPYGGGLDLLLGAERTPGHRWSRLTGAQGEVGDIRGVLPAVEGVTLVAMDRAVGELPGVTAVQAVVRSLARHHRLVVIDAGRTPWPAVRGLVRTAGRTLVVASAGVRSVASAGSVVRAWELPDAGVVVRGTPRLRVPPELVAEALDLPLAGVLPFDRRLAGAAEAGEPPLGGRTWDRAVRRLLATTTQGDDDGD